MKAAAGRQTTVPRLVVNDSQPRSPTIRMACGSQHISLELKGGEILGIAGVAGNGQDELFAALSGERLSQDPGTVVIDGHRRRASVDHRSGASSARPSCPRSGSATAPRRA